MTRRLAAGGSHLATLEIYLAEGEAARRFNEMASIRGRAVVSTVMVQSLQVFIGSAPSS